MRRQKKNRNLYVSEDGSFSAIRNDIIEHLLNYVNEELSKCHGLICSDFELVEFVTSYREVSRSLRSSLSSETVKNALYIKINMPVVAEFDPQPAVLKWLNSKKKALKSSSTG
ncbi:Uncharacterized protein FWK35_00004770 [Aphis craccivora]|uniref:Uncharacterized protein n=1 Tax=Aphis craccivora TaxID=307492 RepID=A0A6G0YI74_APHCR|nr:Uncharacterized protein FWK35_00004770 [Aphis craccivora]